MKHTEMEPESPDNPRANRQRLNRRLLTAVRVIGVVFVFPIIIGAIVASILLNSQRFHSYVLNRLQAEATKTLGVQVHLQNYTLHVATLSADVYGLIVDGASPYTNPPLLQVQHAAAGVRIVSVLRSEWYFDSFRIDRPVVQVFVDKHGVSNIPSFKSSGNSSDNSSVFDFGIRHAVITDGQIFYNNRPAALAADLHNVEFDASFNQSLKQYSGKLAYADGHVTYSNFEPLPHNLIVQFDATPTTLHISQAAVSAGNTKLVINATINNYSAPNVEAQYQMTVDGAEVATLIHNPSVPAGMISASGTLQYQSASNRSAIQALSLNGDLTSPRLSVKTSAAQTDVREIVAHYSLTNGDATLHDFAADILGGKLTAHGTMTNLSGDSHSKVDAALHSVSLAELRRTFAPAGAARGVAVAGAVNAEATANWGKTMKDLVAHADATINGRVTGSPNAALTNGHAISASTHSTANTVPISGAIHATYLGKNQQLALKKSYIRTPHTNVSMNGTVSDRSSLAFQIQANDLREVEAIADIFRTPTPGQPLQGLGLAGIASFRGVVQGSTTAPHLSGQFSAADFHLNGTVWKSLRTDIELDSSHASLKHAELDPGSRGRLTFNASAGLSKWSVTKTSPLELDLKASQLDISDLLKLASQQIPVTGTLNASVNLRGSASNPTGNGDVSLTGLTAYGEPINSAKVIFSGSNNEAHADVAVDATAGSLQGKVSVHPQEKTYVAELTSSGIHLDKLQTVKAKNLDAAGVVAINAHGAGAFDNPQLDASVKIPELLIQKQTVTGLQVQMNLVNHNATVALTSSAVNTSIKGNAKVNLTGDYQAEASLDTQGIPLGPLLLAYAPAQAANVSGQTEIHATLRGPLKKKELLEAHVTLPVLNVAYGSNIQLAAVSPIDIDYKNGIIDVQKSAIRGTDTDLQFQGSIPTTKAPMSLMLIGTVNLQLAQLFNPDLKTSGEIKLNINSHGAADGSNISGQIEIVDANVATTDAPIGLQHGNGVLTLTSDRINISKFQGTVGGGTVIAQGGVALKPAIQFDMGLAAKGVRLLYPEGMRESMDANLRLTGSTDTAVLGGSVNLTDLSFTRAFDLANFIGTLSGGAEAPPTQGFSQNVALNIALHSASNVNLVSRTLSVGGSANLQVKGTAANPVILGRVNLTGGDIILNGNRFVLTDGTVQFVNASETRPVVNLNLSTTIQQYNINMRFNGPVEQLRTQYSSDPSLPSADIIYLLAFGKTKQQSADNPSVFSSQGAESLVASQVSSQVSSRVSKIAGISQLSINPVLANSSTQGPPGANITIQQRVTGNLFVTFSTNVASTQGQTVQGQYQVSPRVAVSATRDPNGGFAVDTIIKKSW